MSFVVAALVLAGVLPSIAASLSTSSSQLTTPIDVHVVWSNHLDVGFNGIVPDIGFAVNVLNRYFDVFIPRALNTSATLRRLHPDGSLTYVWTTHAFVLDLYLDESCATWPLLVPAVDGLSLHCPSSAAREALRAGMRRGDVVVHALAFNNELEWASAATVRAQLALVRRFASAAGVSAPRTVSQRDVPGMTRAALPLFAEYNVTFVSVGVNNASAPPAVPRIFRWRDVASNTTTLTAVHPHGYGGTSVADLALVPAAHVALLPAFRQDNQGPHGVEEVELIVASLLAALPAGSRVLTSTFDAFADAARAVPGAVDALPLVTGEIGDTWIYGVPSDALKVARARDLFRERARADGDDVEALHRFDRTAAKLIEHTWGLSQNQYMTDYVNWDNAGFDAARPFDSRYQRVTESWLEQRRYATLAATTFANASLSSAIHAAWSAHDRLRNTMPPSLAGFDVHSPVSSPVKLANGLRLVVNATGAVRLGSASAAALGQLHYMTLNTSDFEVFEREYNPAGTLVADFIKVGMNASTATHGDTMPSVANVYVSTSRTTVIIELHFPAPFVTLAGAPKRAWTVVSIGGDDDGDDAATDATAASSLPASSSSSLLSSSSTVTARLHVLLEQKRPTRLPESMMLSFDAPSPGIEWHVSKLGSLVRVSEPGDVVVNGSTRVHGFDDDGVIARIHDEDVLQVRSLDAVVAYFGSRSPLPTPIDRAPSARDGVSVALFNNCWGTNYPAWYPFTPEDRNSAFRFEILIKQ